jgi:hypothetical protein
MGIQTLVTGTVMHDGAARASLAEDVLNLAGTLLEMETTP